MTKDQSGPLGSGANEGILSLLSVLSLSLLTGQWEETLLEYIYFLRVVLFGEDNIWQIHQNRNSVKQIDFLKNMCLWLREVSGSKQDLLLWCVGL